MNVSITRGFQLAGLLTLALWSNAVLAWWNDAWPYRMAIAVDASATGANLSESHSEATVLLKLHTGNFEDFFLIKEDLADLRFVADDDKTPLKHHVESFDLLNQLLYIWVKIPQIAGGVNTGKIWMYYGNEAAVSNADIADSYDSSTSLVYHFKTEETLPVDATAYGSNASQMTATVVEAGLIAAGVAFHGNDSLSIPAIPAQLAPESNGMTVSFWMNSEGSEEPITLFELTDGSSRLAVTLQGSNVQASLSSGDNVMGTDPVSVISHGNWQHLAVTVASDSLGLYLDGNLVSAIPVAWVPYSGQWTIGNNAAGNRGFTGTIDELRIDSVARTADWIQIAVTGQGPLNSLLKPQPGEQLGAGKGGNGILTVLLGSVDESGWTVLILLAVMAIISWMVMLGKFLYLRRVLKENKDFNQAYHSLGDKDPGLLDYEESEEDKVLEHSPIVQAVFGTHDHYQSSPIYRLYHRSIQEVNARMGRSLSARASSLSPQAIESIKANIDSQMIREVQRLNSKMVLLTIAISGGPFLGLLGTVLGVMITFGAIAITGDVNISAIAPGVAAALLTTVAGLIVAIPALFGYNYLATGIKECIADMRVFSDELITRLAEYYR